MKKYIFYLILSLAHFAAIAQTDVKNTMVLLQECLNLNSNNQRDVIKLYEQIGVVEYSQANTQQRFKLADLQKVEVNVNNAGFSVDIKCPEETGCISFIKNDTSNSLFQGTAIQFSDAALANTFAENISTLIIHYKTNEAPLEKTLYRNAAGKVPILGVKKAPESRDVPAKQPPAENNAVDQIGVDDEPQAKIQPDIQSKEERDEARVEKKEETQRKAAERKEEREAQAEAKRQARKNKKAETEEAVSNDAQDEPAEKPSARSKRKAARDADQEESASNSAEVEDPNAKRQTARQKNKTSGNTIIEDVGENAVTAEEKEKAGNDFCNQLTTILKSGSENKFKSIEGKLTNAETKINDSKIKLKGARKNYLSWFKKERAFISELKSGNDYELVLKEFENIQTQLDECLGAGWDMEDKSNSEEYAKLKTEVKDVEFKKENDETMPTVRVIFLEDNDKFTMFMRIK